jgi:ATP-dependent RNA helicase DOB1
MMTEAEYIVDVMLYCQLGSVAKPRPAPLLEEGDMLVIPCRLHTFQQLSSLRIVLPKDVRQSDSRKTLVKSLRVRVDAMCTQTCIHIAWHAQEVSRRFPDGVPLLDPIQEMRITDDELKRIIGVCVPL